MAVLRLSNSERFIASLREIHKRLGVDLNQTMIASPDGQNFVLVRMDPLTGIGVQAEPLARFSWMTDEWNVTKMEANGNG